MTCCPGKSWTVSNNHLLQECDGMTVSRSLIFLSSALDGLGIDSLGWIKCYLKASLK